MDIIIICLATAVMLPMLSKIPLGVAMAKAGGYNNRMPRLQQQKLTGFGMRAKAAHENSFEALCLYTPGALLNIILNNYSDAVIAMAITFILARIGYLFMYWYDLDKLRSLFWLVGFGCSLGLLINPL